jgi:Histidine kinase-, DNA gyrase B-, and HSP90-like ATPase
MKLNRFDLGGEIISIITRGMYPDPRDAVREYIQNAIDAKSTTVDVKVRQDSIVIQDNGHGMNHEVLRKAIRVGVSDKNPSKDVGFMGIGIYSAFHLCDKLEIFTKGNENTPNKLSMNFRLMKEILSDQKFKRINNEIKSDELIGLQTLLEDTIEISENGSIDTSEFPSKGTRIEITGLSPVFLPYIAQFDPLAEYLREVIPLHFDPKFIYGKRIEDDIHKICKTHNADFDLITLNLQAGGKNETLYRPYKDVDFNNKIDPQPPIILPIESNGTFLGVVWGCLNSLRKVVDTKDLRGFILKKQGFSIGKRENLIKYFPRGNTFFSRYIGEVIIVHPELLPNASRNDIEFSNLRTLFFEAFTEVADKLDEKGHEFQEWTKADEELSKITVELKRLNAEFFRSGNTTEKLVDLIVKVKNEFDKIDKRIKRNALSPNSEDNANIIKSEAQKLEVLIQEKISTIVEPQRSKEAKGDIKEKSLEIAETLTDLPIKKQEKEKNYENLLELLGDFDVTIQNDLLTFVLTWIDEKFIAGEAINKKDYYIKLNELKAEISKFEELN